MAKIDLVKQQMQTLIDSANETTGKTDTTLTAGVNSLIEGFGQGGGSGECSFTKVFADDIPKIPFNNLVNTTLTIE